MLKNYISIAVRNLLRNKTFSLINVLGLSIGISGALMIFLIITHEFGYDRFEPGGERIYRVVLDATFSGTTGHSAGVPAPLGQAIESEITGVELTVPVFQFQGDATAEVSIAGTKRGLPAVYKKQPNIVFTNTNYFDLLGYRWVAGSPKAALEQPFTVVLTESRATQYFPTLLPVAIIGKQINYNDISTTVSGIVEDLDERSSFTADQFISLPTIVKTNLQDRFMMTVWNDWMAYAQLYVKLSPASKVAVTESQLNTLLRKYNKDANKDAGNNLSLHLQPLSDIHFNQNYQGVGQRLANKGSLYGQGCIAAFLLLLGCINFINLTTAQASKRAKEIGIRKTMGGTRRQLIVQFLSETFLITMIATGISLTAMPALLTAFADMTPPGLHLDLVHQPVLPIFLFTLVIVVSFLSGVYPGLILSGFKPVSVLKSHLLLEGAPGRHVWVRRTLTVSQFVIAQFFIIATLMVTKQINFGMNADLGFRKEAILNFQIPPDTIASHSKLLLHQIQSMPEVEVASTGFLSPADPGVAFTNISYGEGTEPRPNVQIRWGDPNYLNVYQIRLLAGRNVVPADTIKEFIINESYAKTLGFRKPEDALNKYLQFNQKNIPIVGVMQDFHDQSFHASIGPLVFAGRNGSNFHIRLKPNSGSNHLWETAIQKISKAYKDIYPEEAFTYSFFDETIASMYANEQNTARLLKWASAIAIFISCLGLLGLVIYTTNSRTKEIGIRKILGAPISAIVTTLSADFIRLVLIAFVIAAPIAGWATYRWLQDFVYRTSMSWWIFGLSGILMLLFAVITLSIQTVKAAAANPVRSLRAE